MKKQKSWMSMSLSALVFSSLMALVFAPESAKAEDDMMGSPPMQDKTQDSSSTDHDKDHAQMSKDHKAMSDKTHNAHKAQKQKQDAPMMDDDAMAPDKPQDSGMSDM